MFLPLCGTVGDDTDGHFPLHLLCPTHFFIFKSICNLIIDY